MMKWEDEQDWHKEKAIMQQRIDLLNEQIAEFHKRQEDNKKLSNTLISVVNDLNNDQSRMHETELLIINEQLRQEIINVTRRHDDIVQHYEVQIEELKSQLREARRENSQLLVEMERNRLTMESKMIEIREKTRKYQEQLDSADSRIVTERNSRIKLQRELQSLKDQLDNLATVRTEDDEPTKRRDNSIQILKESRDLKSSQQFDDSENNMNSQNIRRRQRVQEYMKKDKTQIKMMVSTLLKAKEKLQQGGQNISCLQDRSTMRTSFGQANRTFYK